VKERELAIRIRCPGQDAREFDPEGVREHPCPRCARQVEFFPTDRSRKCPGCGARFRNPALDIGCAEWCRHAEKCVDFAPRQPDPHKCSDAEETGREP